MWSGLAPTARRSSRRAQVWAATGWGGVARRRAALLFVGKGVKRGQTAALSTGYYFSLCPNSLLKSCLLNSCRCLKSITDNLLLGEGSSQPIKKATMHSFEISWEFKTWPGGRFWEWVLSFFLTKYTKWLWLPFSVCDLCPIWIWNWLVI